MKRLSTTRSNVRGWSGLLSAMCVAVVLTATPSLSRATDFDLQTATIEDINKAFDAGALTSEKLTQLYLNRIAAYDKQGPKINAVITLVGHSRLLLSSC